ncbi:MAG: hypothetical protein ACRDFX_04145 [Chloroflexota bacterium]
MSDQPHGPDLAALESRIAAMSARAPINYRHREQLRNQLLSRHVESESQAKPRGQGSLRRAPWRLKRLILVGPPAVAVAVGFSALVWMVQISGGQNTQTAEAMQRLIKTAPTVTAVRYTLRHSGSGGSSVTRRWHQFNKENQRLYVWGKWTYLWSNGAWSIVPATQPLRPTSVDWELAFSTLPYRLAHHNYTALAARRVDHQMTVGVQYSFSKPGGYAVTATAWVNPSTGLVVRLQRVVLLHGAVTQRDAADYAYEFAR